MQTAKKQGRIKPGIDRWHRNWYTFCEGFVKNVSEMLPRMPEIVPARFTGECWFTFFLSPLRPGLDSLGRTKDLSYEGGAFCFGA